MVATKQMCSFGQVLLYAVLLALICGGTFLMSLQKELKQKVFIACAIVFALLASLVFTFCWTNYRARRQLYKTVRQHHIQVYAIARPDSFPPSYEESQGHRGPAAAESVDSEDVLVSPAPPLYSQDSEEAPGCTWSWEQPPPYSQTGPIQQQEAL